MQHSDYIVYVDESGDHGLVSVDPEYPVFVLAFCIFKKSEYIEQVVPTIQRFKFDFWGHDLTVLHAYDIRKSKGDFLLMKVPEIRERFMQRMNDVMETMPFTLVASVIDKDRLTQKYADPANPYDIALMFCLERTFTFLKDLGQHDKETTICFEQRGLEEDKGLELVFRRIVQGANTAGKMPFDIRFAAKSANLTGMQIADLVAHPIGRNAIKPDQPNRAYEKIEPKFRKSPNGKIRGWGLKHFP